MSVVENIDLMDLANIDLEDLGKKSPPMELHVLIYSVGVFHLSWRLTRRTKQGKVC